MTNDTFKQKFCGSTALKPIRKYTGTQMLGIATMHKSNAVPVFSQQSAQQISNMK
jgi:hypothetical protein